MKNKFLLYPIISGILLSVAWMNVNAAFVIFVALIPFLILEEKLLKTDKSYLKALGCSSLMFAVWNSISTWWIWNATNGGAVGAVLVNTTLYTVMYMVVFFVRKNANRKIARWCLLFFWLSFEYLYTHGEIAWVWLNLGNAFADLHSWVQWYEFTGTLGGTAWVLLLNIFLYELFVAKNFAQRFWFSSYVFISFVPVLIFSFVLYVGYEEQKKNVKALIVQPNVDPYHEKFSGSPSDQLDKILSLAQSKIDSTIQLIVAPETAITASVRMNDLERDYFVKKLEKFSAQYDLNILIGAQTYYIIGKELPSENSVYKAPRFRNGIYYEKYNTAFFVDSTHTDFYHKAKLVVGVEKMPYPSVLKPLTNMFINLGGTTGGLGYSPDRVAFKVNDSVRVAPIICYESIFGEFVTDYVKKGATLLTIITNDGWWGDTDGHRQHLQYARLRAIENRRSILRSANTGISAYFNQRGDLIDSMGWWKQGVIQAQVNNNSKITFYTFYGDYIGRISLFFSILICLSVLISTLKSRQKI